MGLKNTSTLQAIHTSFLIAVFLLPLALPVKVENTYKPTQIISKSIQNLESVRNTVSPPKITQISKETLINVVQSKRENIGLTKLSQNKDLCSQNMLSIYSANQTLSDKDLVEFCPECISSGYVGTMGNYVIENQPMWIESEDISELISGDYSHVCAYTEGDKALVLFGLIPEKNNPAPQFQAQEISIKNFSMQDLWQALIDYRHAHTKPDLQYSQSLCTYAQNRVNEHIKMYSERTIEEYENQDKYPLDAHAGFRRDGESGEVFNITGFNVVAENLAYWPTAEFPHQVIEWGWDTSTEGHKEAQLSTEYSHACLAGNQGFYVAIFARN